MWQTHRSCNRPEIAKRLKRADDPLLSVVAMIENERPCLGIVLQRHVVGKTITRAKRALIQDHIDRCRDAARASSRATSRPFFSARSVIET
ncbi:MAG TPA: metal-sensing transcriptional repressor [Roseibacterium sp.]|nr:metal-sensing transcriptional repressor [Roseibacterium sp.]